MLLLHRAIAKRQWASAPRRGDRRLPALPAAGLLARAGGARAPRGVRAGGVLGASRAGLRRPGRAPAAVGARAGGPWRQSHRADVHRRPLGRLPLRGAVALRAGEPADLDGAGGRPTPRRDVGERRGPLRATREPSDTGRARRVPALERRRAGSAAEGARDRVPRRVRVGCRAAAPGGERRRRASPRLRPRPRFSHAAELVGEAYALVGCYHPSQQNTFTGRLTEPMIDAVLLRALALAERAPARAG
jgi:hypothetical protein